MGMIAECAGGFCCAGRDGKIYFKIIGQDEAEMPLKLFKNHKFGEEYKISRLAYEDGTRSFKFGNETRNTLWVSQDNIFIVDEDQVEKIYNKVKDLTINSFEGTSIINPAWDMGDKIIIDEKPIIYQGEMRLANRFIADIKSNINIKQKQETTIKREAQKSINRKVQSRIDEVDGKITQLVQETTENSEKLTQHEQTIDGMKDVVSNVEEKVESIENTTIVKVDVEYALGTSETIAPTEGWSTTAPTWENGKYMWQRTMMTYVDGNTEISNPTCISGAKGDTGEKGSNGQNGENGIGVKEIEEQYYLSSSDTEQIDGDWKTTQDEWTIGKYIWTRNKITWTDDNITYTTAVLATGINNANSVASNANTNAETAKTTADTAKNTADEAKTTAENTNKNLSENYYTRTQTDSQITQKADSITSEVNKTISTAKQEAIDSSNTATDNKLKDYSTTTQMNSKIEQTAEGINSEVSKKVGENEIISKINQSAEETQIEANKISLKRKRNRFNWR